MNRFGDWYLATPDGSIHLLSIWEGVFEPVAASLEEWHTWLASEDGMETNWCDLVIRLFDRGQVLADGECFAFTPPPAVGADIDVDRISVMGIGAISIVMGQLFEQLARPPGP